jgi:hypothetical protein
MRSHGAENALRRSRDLDAGEDVSFGEVGDRARLAVLDAAHSLSW